MNLFLILFLIILGTGGFSLAFFIFKSKRQKKPMVCPLDGHCEEVTSSQYSKFFGVPVEILGMLYYAAVASGYGFFLIYPGLIAPQIIISLAALTFFSFLFSLYLTFIQAFNLKQWCTWCLMSAGISSFIFLASFLNLKFGEMPIPAEFFKEISEIIGAGYFIGTALGFGVSAVYSVIFLKFIKDFNISKTEADVMHILTEIVWFSLFIFILSGFGLYVSEPEIFFINNFFFFKIAAVALILLSSSVFNLLMAPKLIKKSLIAGCNGKKICSPAEVRFSMSLNAVSVFSWIFILIFR